MTEPLTPAERRLRGQLGAHESWARTEDRAARTRPAREAFEERFLREVDPEGILDPAERARRAASARKAHFARMSYQAARARSARRNKPPDE